jgi:hypothetical protein
MRGTRAQAIAALGLLTFAHAIGGQAAGLRPTAPGSGFLPPRLLLLTGGDPPGVAEVATVPPGEGPAVDDLGVYDGVAGSWPVRVP